MREELSTRRLEWATAGEAASKAVMRHRSERNLRVPPPCFDIRIPWTPQILPYGSRHPASLSTRRSRDSSASARAGTHSRPDIHEPHAKRSSAGILRPIIRAILRCSALMMRWRNPSDCRPCLFEIQLSLRSDLCALHRRERRLDSILTKYRMKDALRRSYPDSLFAIKLLALPERSRCLALLRFHQSRETGDSQ
ncbi:hypothetical protein FHT76_003591 [Rhizobium sp. BK176]|nr:hypothetical protein [Rhizobium sp. BK399]MCS4091925.1 hypothetical protein [Rhizobium sp. BK176]